MISPAETNPLKVAQRTVGTHPWTMYYLMFMAQSVETRRSFCDHVPALTKMAQGEDLEVTKMAVQLLASILDADELRESYAAFSSWFCWICCFCVAVRVLVSDNFRVVNFL
jgi:hypothetical protein